LGERYRRRCPAGAPQPALLVWPAPHSSARRERCAVDRFAPEGELSRQL